ncbi:MAG: 2-methylaconitate cis-trans isomerase PrpF family protein [Clostridium sp.]|jgi:2-methylaconitate cis-trans-isomerase PrpF
MRMKKYPCVYMRGGTSKAVVFHEKDLPEDRTQWEKIFLGVMGTPDPKQIDGMGGTASSTSKVAVIAPSKRPGIDVDYTFFQVGISQASVVDNVNCGNISSTVGPFAIDEGLVEITEPKTTVRIYNTNTGKIMEEIVSIEDGQAAVYGSTEISGVPGTGAEIDEAFFEPGGSVTGKTYPSGNKKDLFTVPGFGTVEGTIVDAGTAVVFVKADDFGLIGTEGLELADKKEIVEALMMVRGKAAVLCGLVENWEEAERVTPAVPDLVIISGPKTYRSLDGSTVCENQMDLCARVFSCGLVHKAFPVTTSITLGTAACTEGTLVNEILRKDRANERLIRIGHISGIFPVTVTLEDGVVKKASVIRTARRIMDGYVYVK